jgi:kynurenine 3-monooxygenase
VNDQPQFTIVGAGLSGALMACYLGRAGYRLHLIERRSDPRATGGGEGRSINLAISTRGLHALNDIGVGSSVLEVAVPMRGRMMHDRSGGTSFQPYGTQRHDVINSVSRGGLNALLLKEAEKSPSVRLTFETRVTRVDLGHAALTVASRGGSPTQLADCGIVVGADGAFSAVRARMQRLDRFDYQQAYLTHGYKELTIPPAEGGGFRLEPNALHIWPRGGAMMIALPNHDGSFTCTLFWPFRGPYGLESLTTEQAVLDFFSREFPDVVPLMPTLPTDYLRNPNSSLVTVRCGPWHYAGRVVLIGDACHAVVPFYGQGANAAFEDCTVLYECIRAHQPDWQRVFERYYAARKTHTDALADLAVANFVEMRDHVASRAFRSRKRLESFLHRVFPKWFLPLYTMVTFTRIPYAIAVQRARRQALVVRVVVVVLLVALLAGVFMLWR